MISKFRNGSLLVESQIAEIFSNALNGPLLLVLRSHVDRYFLLNVRGMGFERCGGMLAQFR